ncbi:AP-1 complex-associated regulatory protein isoform X1 [Callorhinchus milii]|uniref:AP-1 complex-associated regulatory protein isoform X1 n=1 Tax=Callorhinchus milii TaxID=7868 RepID=UPI000457369A|nr:AP-1 complex-associated regulatory protein isoform X1 [Callorhinchus milii]|eukprot:gi/632958708/ref/XP_007895194.1/ PREDICTED: AP-1 complex-associated regulatory protein isoform X2 [Callorhinchus milii]
MGNCWAQCFGLFRKEANRIQRGGGSKYFRSSAHGEHFTIEFENLVESDEGESPGANPRPISEDEIQILQNRHYDSIAERQGMVDSQLQTEQQRLQKMKRRAKVAATPDQQKGDGGEEDFESYLQNAKSQSEAFRNQCRISSEPTILTPNTESSCDLTVKTKSTSGNDDSTSLDLEWEDEEGINRLIPMRERSKTEEDILQAALRHSSRRPGSNPMSASDESTGLEWENDFVSAELDDNGNSEYAGFVNPVLELSPSDVTTSESDQQG